MILLKLNTVEKRCSNLHFPLWADFLDAGRCIICQMILYQDWIFDRLFVLWGKAHVNISALSTLNSVSFMSASSSSSSLSTHAAKNRIQASCFHTEENVSLPTPKKHIYSLPQDPSLSIYRWLSCPEKIFSQYKWLWAEPSGSHCWLRCLSVQ